MSQNNDNSGGGGLAFVGVGLFIMVCLAYAVAAFFAVLMTVIALIAWRNTLTIGSLTVEPEDARAFVYRGLIGAAVVPAFAAFTCFLFETHIDWNQWFFHFALSGYSFGSFIIGLINAQEQAEVIAIAPVATPPSLPKPTAPTLLPERPECRDCPFIFASWDDEEEGR